MKTKLSILVLLFLAFSCSNEKALQPLKESAIKVEKDYLSVPDEETLMKLLVDLQKNTVEEQRLFEQKLGFTSLKMIFNDAVDENTKYFESLERLDESSLQGYSKHSEYVLSHSNLFVFLEEGGIDLKISHKEMASVLNADGIINVGDELRKYTADAYLVSSISGLDNLRKSSLTKTYPGVRAFPVTSLRNEINSARYVTSTFSVNSCTGTAGRYRVRLYEDIYTQPIGGGTWKLTHYFTVKSFRRYTFGGEQNFATSALEGGVSYQATWGNNARYIYANGTQHEIGDFLMVDYIYSEQTPPQITFSYGSGRGRDGCNCSYTGYY